MPRPSVVVQAMSDDGSQVGNNFATAAGAIVRALLRREVSAKVEIAGTSGKDWVRSQNIPETEPGDLAAAQVLVRSFYPAAAWPPRPLGVSQYVIDLALSPATSSGAADYTLSLTGGSDATAVETPTLTINSELYPVPDNVFTVRKAITPKLVVFFLGMDYLGRLAALCTAVQGFNGMAAKGIRYPTQGTPTPPWPTALESPALEASPEIVQTPTPWTEMRSADIAVTIPGFANRIAATLRIPTLVVASNAFEQEWITALTAEGPANFDYLGMLSGLSDNQVRASCDGLVNGESSSVEGVKNADTRRRVMRLAGQTIAEHGDPAGKIAQWIGRKLVGAGARDPFKVKGYDTIRKDGPV